MKGLDIYLTTDPNDQIDWGDQGATCPKCSCDVFEEIDSHMASEENTVRLWCADCGEEFDYKFENNF